MTADALHEIAFWTWFRGIAAAVLAFGSLALFVLTANALFVALVPFATALIVRSVRDFDEVVVDLAVLDAVEAALFGGGPR